MQAAPVAWLVLLRFTPSAHRIAATPCRACYWLLAAPPALSAPLGLRRLAAWPLAWALGWAQWPPAGAAATLANLLYIGLSGERWLRRACQEMLLAPCGPASRCTLARMLLRPGAVKHTWAGCRRNWAASCGAHWPTEEAPCWRLVCLLGETLHLLPLGEFPVHDPRAQPETPCVAPTSMPLPSAAIIWLSFTGLDLLTSLADDRDAGASHACGRPVRKASRERSDGLGRAGRAAHSHLLWANAAASHETRASFLASVDRKIGAGLRELLSAKLWSAADHRLALKSASSASPATSTDAAPTPQPGKRAASSSAGPAARETAEAPADQAAAEAAAPAVPPATPAPLPAAPQRCAACGAIPGMLADWQKSLSSAALRALPRGAVLLARVPGTRGGGRGTAGLLCGHRARPARRELTACTQSHPPQRAHWPLHQRECRRPAARAASGSEASSSGA